MKYKIDITGMHGAGCTDLMKMGLEDFGFIDVSVNLMQNAVFHSLAKEQDMREKLNDMFANPGLAAYAFTNLTTI